MPDPLAHVYDLALRALAEQERQVTALRGRRPSTPLSSRRLMSFARKTRG